MKLQRDIVNGLTTIEMEYQGIPISTVVHHNETIQEVVARLVGEFVRGCLKEGKDPRLNLNVVQQRKPMILPFLAEGTFVFAAPYQGSMVALTVWDVDGDAVEAYTAIIKPNYKLEEVAREALSLKTSKQ